eukprot:gnl/MRDRNA2_/MRDRNA2_86214_c0_seq3.p1 gnl/MRDRNA2_/MRDRNA2_86214_c0~~gnl/MRDRNA2_/MRDRNA2_86214_c0_seq3.p1  ORF type:complete len:184 (+),score=34.34 gnl/MRDRNA2_/MRDRNA2_86214_c0_seq3:65-553(+)
MLPRQIPDLHSDSIYSHDAVLPVAGMLSNLELMQLTGAPQVEKELDREIPQEIQRDGRVTSGLWHKGRAHNMPAATSSMDSSNRHSSSPSPTSSWSQHDVSVATAKQKSMFRIPWRGKQKFQKKAEVPVPTWEATEHHQVNQKSIASGNHASLPEFDDKEKE